MKLHKKLLVALAIMGMSFSVAMAKDIQTVSLKVEQMECENCAAKVKENIRFEKGVKKVETDVKSRTVTLSYDADKTNTETLAKGFNKFHYTATPIKDSCCDTKKEDCKDKKECTDKDKKDSCCSKK